VIEHGRSGIVVDHYRDIPLALEEVEAIDPWECRRYVEERFAPERMVAAYVEAYRAVIESAAEPAPA
jgi:glycosyltransferase involved in cell wall biosynthesis